MFYNFPFIAHAKIWQSNLFNTPLYIHCIVKLSINLCGTGVLLVLEFINMASILNYTEFNILLYTFFVLFFAQYKQYMLCLISFSNFSDLLPVSTCASATGNLWSICLEVNILSPFHFNVLCLASNGIIVYSSSNWITSFLELKSLFIAVNGSFVFSDLPPPFLIFLIFGSILFSILIFLALLTLFHYFLAIGSLTLREKCPDTEFFLVRIFPYSNWMLKYTPYLSIFSPNAVWFL